MTVDSNKPTNKYFCNNCKDRNWLIECEWECNDILSRTDERYRPRKYLYGHYQKQRIGELNPKWKGGRYFDESHGYWHILLPNYFSSDSRGYILEHVYFYQEYHKCCILPWAVVHHIDKNKENNMPWNLEGMMRNDHIRMHNMTTRIYKRKDMTDIRCSRCDSDKTYIRKHGQPHWLKDNKGGWLCLSCYGKQYKKITSI